MVGPIGLVGSQQIGVVTEGHDRMPYMDMAWSPLWMSRLLEQCGFVRHLGMRTSEVDVGSIDIDALRLQGNDKLANHDITIEPITGDTLRAEARLIRRLGNEAFACVPYFAPVSQADSDFRLRSLKDVLDPRIAFIARIDGRPAGIVLCIPDLNPLLHDLRGKTGLLAPFIWLKHRLARPKRAVLIFYAVAPRFQGLGLNGLMLSEVARGMRRGGYKTFGITWIEDSNKPSLRQVEKLGGRPLHRLYLYRRDLERPDAQTENDVARISEIVEPKMPSIHG
ncbi:GNAT family N-acetyltransferase [Salmonella enterica subsp. enterica serovar Enteritidis]|nr:GNAT family N-acetyltransferase [Salmonella enterica subsp. enterica serovar Enteritidis]